MASWHVILKLVEYDWPLYTKVAVVHSPLLKSPLHRSLFNVSANRLSDTEVESQRLYDMDRVGRKRLSGKGSTTYKGVITSSASRPWKPNPI